MSTRMAICANKVQIALYYFKIGGFLMVTIAVDVDGVLLDVHSALEEYLHNKGYSEFSMERWLTYDMNKSLDIETHGADKAELGAPHSEIIKAFNDLELFKQSKVDESAVGFIREQAQTGRVKYIIYTLSYTDEIRQWKKDVFFEKYFGGVENVEFRGIVASDKEACDSAITAVIEDSPLALEKYAENIRLYLIDKPYNSREYNPKLKALFDRPQFSRSSSTIRALLVSSIELGTLYRGGSVTEAVLATRE